MMHRSGSVARAAWRRRQGRLNPVTCLLRIWTQRACSAAYRRDGIRTPACTGGHTNMRISSIRRSIWGVLLLAAAMLAVAGQNCDDTRALAEVDAARRAWADSRPDDALRFLNNSIEECASYEAYEQLGE